MCFDKVFRYSCYLTLIFVTGHCSGSNLYPADTEFPGEHGLLLWEEKWDEYKDK